MKQKEITDSSSLSAVMPCYPMQPIYLSLFFFFSNWFTWQGYETWLDKGFKFNYEVFKFNYVKKFVGLRILCYGYFTMPV